MSFKAQLGIDNKEFLQGIRDAQKESANLESAVSSNFSKIEKTFKSVGKTLSLSVTAPLTALGALSVKTFTDFSFQMAQVGSISGATAKQFEALKKSALDLGATTAFSSSEVAMLQLNLSKLGFRPEEINNATAGILDLALAMGEDLGQSAEVAASTLQGFGLGAEETNRITDVMAKSFSSSALDLNKFSNAMSKVAPVAKTANVSVEQTTGYLSVLANAGLEASVAGTSLRNIFLQLSKSGMTFDEAMDKIAGSSNKSAAAIELFREGGATAAITLAENADEARRLADEYLRAEGAAKEMADAMNNTLWGAFQNLKSAGEALLITIGDHLAPAIQTIANTLSSFAGYINNLPPNIQKAAIAVGALAAAAGPLLLSLGGIVKILPLVGTGFAALTSPIGLVVGAIVGAVALITANWDRIVNYFTRGAGSQTFERVRKSVVSLSSTVREAFGKIRDVVSVVMPYIQEIVISRLEMVFGVISSTIGTVVTLIDDSLSVLIKLFQGDFKGAFEGLKTLVANIFNGILDIVRNALTGISDQLASFFDKIGLNSVADRIRDFATKVTPAQKELTESVEEFTEATQSATDVTAGFSESLDDTTKKGENFRSKLNEILAGFGIYEYQVAVVSEKFGEFRDIARKAGSTLQELTTIDLAEWATKTEMALSRVNFSSANVGGLGGAGLSIPISLKVVDVGGSAISGIKDQATRLAEEFNSQLNDVLQAGLVDVVGGFAESIGTALADGGSVIESMGSALLGSLGGILVSLGKMVTEVGAGVLAVELSLKSLNPFVALAAGAALIAIGSAFKGKARNLGKGMGGGGYSSSVSSGDTRYTSPFDSTRGAYYGNERQVVDLELKNGNLVGAIKWSDERNNRLA